MSKYVCTHESWKTRLLTESQVRECINTFYPGTILPKELNDTLLEYFQIQKVTEIENKYVIYDLTPYCTYSYGMPYQEQDGKWYVHKNMKLDESKVENRWKQLRATRDTRLQETDWIESSDLITEGCKLKYKIYRQLLRDCLNITSYPTRVIFPKKPEIVYRNTRTLQTYLTDEEIEKIKDYKPEDKDKTDWFVFLTEWAKTLFNPNKSYVKNLIMLHTNLIYEAII